MRTLCQSPRSLLRISKRARFFTKKGTTSRLEVRNFRRRRSVAFPARPDNYFVANVFVPQYFAFPMTFDPVVNAHSRQYCSYIPWTNQFNYSFSCMPRECTMQPFASSSAMQIYSLMPLIIDRRSNTLVISGFESAVSEKKNPSQKWQPWRLIPDEFSLARPFPTCAKLNSALSSLTRARLKIFKRDTRDHREMRLCQSFLDGPKWTSSKIRFYVVNYRLPRWRERLPIYRDVKS